jgi:copper chaperone NosL
MMKVLWKDKSRLLHLIAAFMLAGLFIAPIWKIRLEAPQYPEGIVMYIWLNKITGNDPNTLNSVNILNHYIGMQPITPESIPELKYFPYVNIFLILSGLLVFTLNKKSLRIMWLLVLVTVAGLGIYDFYLWEYDYGHNLDPMAAIKIPGMVYQPPLFGTKWLLNFKAYSYPHIGGILMAVSVCTAGFATLMESRFFSIFKKLRSSSLFLLTAFMFESCKVGPEPINYGHDLCEHCSMTIMDARYGSEVVTRKGRILRFDSIECMARYSVNKKEEREEIQSVWITDYTKPGELTDANAAYYLISKELGSPMGANLTGFSSLEKAQEKHRDHGGRIYNWSELQEHFRNK